MGGEPIARVAIRPEQLGDKAAPADAKDKPAKSESAPKAASAR